MPADLLARVVGDTFVCINDRAKAAAAKLQGKIIKISIVQPRNPAFLRKYWKLIDVVFENIETTEAKDVDEFHDMIKLMTGCRKRIQLPNDLRNEYGEVILPAGSVCFIPGSVAFANMTEETFGRFFDRVCDLVTVYFWRSVTVDWLKSQVAQLIGIEDKPRNG